jgi:hypothetical protein
MRKERRHQPVDLVVDLPEESGARCEDRHVHLGQGRGEGVDTPGVVAEEATESRLVADADWPPEKMTSMMKRCRWERTQPASNC